MKCPNCGREIANDSNYCEYCGKKVKTSSKAPLRIIIVLTVIILALVILVSLLRQGSAPKAGTTLSYTERLVSEDRYDTITSYFVFNENNEVIWLMGTPQKNMFPLGFGKYKPSAGEVTFSASDTLHQGISIYYGVEDAIVFNFDLTKKTARLKTDDKWLKPLYNNGNVFSLIEENYTLQPSKELVGSNWSGRYENYNIAFAFKSWNEVAVEEDGEEVLRAYVCFDNMVSIKAGDNLEYENFIGKYLGNNDMTLCRDGIDAVSHSDECVTLRKITDESDTEAFLACQTVDDYRTYIAIFGEKALCYEVASDSIRLFVEDSIAKMESTEVKDETLKKPKQGIVFQLTDSNFSDFLSISFQKPVIIDFYGSWCGPCREMESFLDKLIKDYSGRIAIGRYRVDKNSHGKMINKYTIDKIPTLLFVKSGKIVDRVVGFAKGKSEKEIVDKIEQGSLWADISLKDQEQIEEQLKAQGFVDLGLPSGIWWKNMNENDFYTYHDAIIRFGKHLPSIYQLWELRNNCDWVLQKDQSEYLVTGPNGNSIIVPLAGIMNCEGNIILTNTCGHLLSSTLKDSDHLWTLRVWDDCIQKDYGGELCTKCAVRLVQNPYESLR